VRIFLVRHAMSQWQADHGAGLDSELSPLGLVQAEHLARWAGTRPRLGPGQRFDPDRMFVSPLRRARQTAVALQHSLGVPSEVCQHLAEPPLSVETLLPTPEGPLRPRQAIPADTRYAGVRRSAQRALEVLVEAAEDSSGGVVVVGHAGLIRTMVRCLVDSDVVCFGLFNTALIGLEWTDARWRLSQVNLCEHLPAELRT
jgi:broad specificity phosphatase PhoE